MPYKEIEIIQSGVNALHVFCNKCGRILNDGGGDLFLLLNHHGYPDNTEIDIHINRPSYYSIKVEDFYHSKKNKKAMQLEILKNELLKVEGKRFEINRKNKKCANTPISDLELREAELHVQIHNIYFPDHITRRVLFTS